MLPGQITRTNTTHLLLKSWPFPVKVGDKFRKFGCGELLSFIPLRMHTVSEVCLKAQVWLCVVQSDSLNRLLPPPRNCFTANLLSDWDLLCVFLHEQLASRMHAELGLLNEASLLNLHSPNC